MTSSIYTIGYSCRSVGQFAHTLRQCGVDCVVDVRPQPSDSLKPQYDAAALSPLLKEYGIRYLDFTHEFAACSANPSIDYALATATSSFLRGAERIALGVQRGFHIALMAAEADPTRCYRFTHVSRYLDNEGFTVRHIMPDDTVVPHECLTTRPTPLATHEATGHSADIMFVDAVMLAIRLGKMRYAEQREALLAAARAATSPLTFMSAIENFGIAHHTPLHQFLGQVMAAPEYFRDRYARVLGIPAADEQPQPFLNNIRAISLVEPLLSPKQCSQFREMYWWFTNNHNQRFFNARKGEIQIGAYATAPHDNASTLARFESYLRRLADSTNVAVRKRYEGFPFDIIISLENRTFLPRQVAGKED